MTGRRSDLHERLQCIADEGGTLETSEGHYDDLREEGFVTTRLTGGGWGYTEEVELTSAGRRALGLPLVTQSPRVSFLTKWTVALGLRKRT